MKRSTERILTTFVGSLTRSVDLIELLKAKESGQDHGLTCNSVPLGASKSCSRSCPVRKIVTNLLAALIAAAGTFYFLTSSRE